MHKKIHKSKLLLLCLVFIMPLNAYGFVSTLASFLGCLSSELKKPEVKSFEFIANIVTKEENGVNEYKATGACAYEKQVCEGGTLFNSWNSNSEQFKSIGHNSHRWVIKLENGWDLSFDFPGCKNLANPPLDPVSYRIWLTKNPEAPPHKQLSIWRNELVNEESFKKHGFQVIDVSISRK